MYTCWWKFSKEFSLTQFDSLQNRKIKISQRSIYQVKKGSFQHKKTRTSRSRIETLKPQIIIIYVSILVHKWSLLARKLPISQLTMMVIRWKNEMEWEPYETVLKCLAAKRRENNNCKHNLYPLEFRITQNLGYMITSFTVFSTLGWSTPHHH